MEGNVIVASGARLEASGVSVDGNVQADGQAAVTVDGDSFVGGDVQVENGAAASVSSSDIDGNIQIEPNAGAIIVTDNIVGGDIQVNANTGGGNTVAGNKEGQCSGL